MKNLTSVFALVAALLVPLSAAEPETGFVALFDGKTLEGWKVNEAKFKDFELRLDVMTRKTSNGGVFIHTVFCKSGWPGGYEVQVNNTQSDPQKSGGLYNTVKNLVPFEDDAWMAYVITVKDGTVTVKVNDKQLADYKTEPGSTKLRPEGGTLAFQAHDKDSTTFYKNIRIKVLK